MDNTPSSPPINILPTLTPAPTSVNLAPVTTIPILPPADGTFVYIAVKGSLYAADCAVFGLNEDEIVALAGRFSYSSSQIINGVVVKTHLLNVLNSLSQLGYKVVCSTGETETVWTMAREI